MIMKRSQRNILKSRVNNHDPISEIKERGRMHTALQSKVHN